MISLHNYRILKDAEIAGQISSTGTDAVFGAFELKTKEEEPAQTETDKEKKQPIKKAPVPQKPSAEIIFQNAVERAEVILEAAKREAEEIKKEARDEGFVLGVEEGKESGKQQAWEEEQELVRHKLQDLEIRIANYVTDMEHEKEKLLEQYLDDLKDISLAIAEKIVQTSLKSSSEVIKRMILAATETLKKTAWAKIYVSQIDDMMEIQGDMQLMKELSKLSENVKIIIMEDTEPGTCIIELPQEIIDISTNAQMENIKDILNNARL